MSIMHLTIYRLAPLYRSGKRRWSRTEQSVILDAEGKYSIYKEKYELLVAIHRMEMIVKHSRFYWVYNGMLTTAIQVYGYIIVMGLGNSLVF